MTGSGGGGHGQGSQLIAGDSSTPTRQGNTSLFGAPWIVFWLKFTCPISATLIRHLTTFRLTATTAPILPFGISIRFRITVGHEVPLLVSRCLVFCNGQRALSHSERAVANRLRTIPQQMQRAFTSCRDCNLKRSPGLFGRRGATLFIRLQSR